MRVVVGLGNPGKQYHGTRHNVGFAVVDGLAAGPFAGRFQSRFQAQVAELMEGNEKVLLVKPETFMNLSGRAVRQVIDFYQVGLADLLVVCDDINLPLGKLRIRHQGDARRAQRPPRHPEPSGDDGIRSTAHRRGRGRGRPGRSRPGAVSPFGTPGDRRRASPRPSRPSRSGLGRESKCV